MLTQLLLFQIKICLKLLMNKQDIQSRFNFLISVLLHGVQSVTDLMVKDGLVNLDFADVETCNEFNG